MPKKWILLSTTDEVIIHIVELLYVFFKVLLMFVVVKAFIQKKYSARAATMGSATHMRHTKG